MCNKAILYIIQVLQTSLYICLLELTMFNLSFFSRGYLRTTVIAAFEFCGLLLLRWTSDKTDFHGPLEFVLTGVCCTLFPPCNAEKTWNGIYSLFCKCPKGVEGKEGRAVFYRRCPNAPEVHVTAKVSAVSSQWNLQCSANLHRLNSFREKEVKRLSLPKEQGGRYMNTHKTRTHGFSRRQNKEPLQLWVIIYKTPCRYIYGAVQPHVTFLSDKLHSNAHFRKAAIICAACLISLEEGFRGSDGKSHPNKMVSYLLNCG